MEPEFIEKPLTGKEPARCVDGRDADGSEQGAQMLGGSLHPILLKAIHQGINLDRAYIIGGIMSLKVANVVPGAHRGEHAKDVVSDCGAADRTAEIIDTAIKNRAEITNRLNKVYVENSEKFAGFNLPPFEQMINSAYAKIASYGPDKIKIKGENLVSAIDGSGCFVEKVKGDHAEAVAYVNIKPLTTLDTRALNAKGAQGFNLDLLPAVEHSKAIGVPQDFAIAASLILYQATEMVLVEQKGKEALPVVIHS